MSEAFLLGNGQISRIQGQRGETPPCPSAKFKRGDVVNPRKRAHLQRIPQGLAVAVAIPPGFSPDYALADLVGEPRPLMCQVGSKAITYILVRENDTKPYLLKEADLLATGVTVEFGETRRETDAEAAARSCHVTTGDLK